jgi:cytochrome c-type biogenesis protein
MSPLILFAGFLSVLSPCVLPMIPILAGTAARRNTRGIVFLILGFLGSFALIQIGLSVLKDFFFLDIEWLRRGGAVLMIVMGFLMLAPQFSLFSGVSRWAHWIPRKPGDLSLRTNLLEGFSFALVWSPCIGPALGATLGLLSTRQHRMLGSFDILLFGVGAAIPLFFLGLGFQKLRVILSARNQKRLRYLHKFSAVAYFLLGIAVLFRWDKYLEAAATSRLPEWWADLLSKY